MVSHKPDLDLSFLSQWHVKIIVKLTIKGIIDEMNYKISHHPLYPIFPKRKLRHEVT